MMSVVEPLIVDDICATEPNVRKEEPKRSTPWASVYVCGLGGIIQAAQFSIYVSSMWPYLLNRNPSISETALGFVVAANAIAQCFSGPLFGYWANKLGQVRTPLIAGFIFMMIGNCVYLGVQFVPVALVPYTMMLARAITGTGSGNGTVLRTYVASVSSMKDRSRAVACVTGGIAVGSLVGPVFQLIFTPLGKDGVQIGWFTLNIFTAPALFAFVSNVLGIVLMKYGLKNAELIAGGHKKMEGGKVLARPDRIALLICVMTRFTQIYGHSTIQTITSPYSMMMFNFDKEQAVAYNAAAHAVAGGCAVILFIFFVGFHVSKHLRERLTSIACQGLMLLMFVATFSWPFIGSPVEPRVNGTDAGCDFDRFWWCSSMTTINPWVYYFFYVLLFGVSRSFINVSLTTLYSKIIGPHKQGTLHGFFQMAGSIGLFCAPLIATNAYSYGGPRIVWGIAAAEILGNVSLWFIFYRRLVPFDDSLE